MAKAPTVGVHIYVVWHKYVGQHDTTVRQSNDTLSWYCCYQTHVTTYHI